MPPMPGRMPRVTSGQLEVGAGRGHPVVAADGQLHAAAERHAVDGGDHRLGHAVDVHQQAAGIARVLGRARGVAEHVDEAADLGPRAERLGVRSPR